MMKKIILSAALLGTALVANANNFNMPSFGNNNGYNNGSNWNMPNMNWGNGNGNNNGSNWNMPNMNLGNNNGYGSGSNWSMPNMNWGNGNNNGYGNGSNWSMPNMNWGNGNGNGFNNGSNWSMPNFNGNNNNTPWNFGNNGYRPSYPSAPNVQYRPPAPRMITPPRLKVQAKPVPQAAQIIKKAVKPITSKAKIPLPTEVKGVILAPTNKPKEVEKSQ